MGNPLDVDVASCLQQDGPKPLSTAPGCLSSARSRFPEFGARSDPGSAHEQVLAQFLYTSAFGWYATWLFCRTGRLVAPVAVHMLCNALGFPDFERMSAHPAQPLLSAATAAGVVLFSVLLRPLTDPSFYGGAGILDALPA